MENNRDTLWVDYVRVAASFLVILVHTCSSTVTQYTSLPIIDWQVGNVYASLARVAVPLFFMLSGYLLLEKKESLQDVFFKRIKNILIPLIAWSIFYIFWGIRNVGFEQLALNDFSKIIFTPVHFHLWFLYALLGLYLCLPILRLIIRYSSESLLHYILILWFTAVAVIPFIEKALKMSSEIDLALTSGYMGYLILGYLLGKIVLTRKIFYMAILLMLFMFTVTVAGTYILTLRDDGLLNRYLYSYLSPNIILMAMASFVILKYFFIHLVKKKGNHEMVKNLSSSSFGIYLVHVVFLDILYNGYLGFVLSPASFSVSYSIPVTAAVIFVLSYLQVSLFKKIPLLQKIV